MARALVALKVKVGLIGSGRDAGKHEYPDFDSISVSIRRGLRWQDFIQTHGVGWQYDFGGHNSDTVDSPFGVRFGLIIVPQNFATAALAAFPTTVTQLTEVQATAFYDNDSKHAREADVTVFADRLVPIQIKLQRGQVLTQADEDALDPTKKVAGVVENPNKNWVRFKASRGFTIL